LIINSSKRNVFKIAARALPPGDESIFEFSCDDYSDFMENHHVQRLLELYPDFYRFSLIRQTRTLIDSKCKNATPRTYCKSFYTVIIERMTEQGRKWNIFGRFEKDMPEFPAWK